MSRRAHLGPRRAVLLALSKPSLSLFAGRGGRRDGAAVPSSESPAADPARARGLPSLLLLEPLQEGTSLLRTPWQSLPWAGSHAPLARLLGLELPRDLALVDPGAAARLSHLQPQLLVCVQQVVARAKLRSLVALPTRARAVLSSWRRQRFLPAPPPQGGLPAAALTWRPRWRPRQLRSGRLLPRSALPRSERPRRRPRPQCTRPGCGRPRRRPRQPRRR
jgi:hypothetical protein